MIVKSRTSPSGYAIVDDAPDRRREMTAAERAAAKKADELDEAAVIALIGIRPDEAARFAFPKGRKVTGTRFRLWGQPEWLVWSRAAVLDWRDGLRALASTMERR